jgi:hypothetical protein
MAFRNCNTLTISNALNIPEATLRRRFGEVLTKKRAEGKVALRKLQWEHAKSSPAMAIFLGKNILGQTDRQTLDNRISGDIIFQENRKPPKCTQR